MAFIPLDGSKPGMRSLLAYYPAIAKPLTGLMKLLMRSESGVDKSESELIATYVSGLNHCKACEDIHGTVAYHLNERNEQTLRELKDNQPVSVSARLKSLLELAANVQESGLNVSSNLIEKLKSNGCSDREIHDAVLITALFCMFNRYIDGLGIKSNDTLFSLNERGKHIAEYGY